MAAEDLEDRCKQALKEFGGQKRFGGVKRELSACAVQLLNWEQLGTRERNGARKALGKHTASEHPELDSSPDARRAAILELCEKRRETEEEQRAFLEEIDRLHGARIAELQEELEKPEEERGLGDPDKMLRLLESNAKRCRTLLESLSRRERFQDELELFWFSSDDAWVEFLENEQCPEYEPGSTIIHQGEFTQNFFVVVAGEVNVYLVRDQVAQDARELVDTMKAGEPAPWFGEMSALANRPAVAQVTTVTDATLLRLPPPLFRTFYDDGKFTWFKEHVDRVYADRSLFAELRRIPAFHGLPEDERREISSVGEFVSWDEGELVAARGEPAEALYLLRSGRLVAQRADGSSLPHEILLTGASFGEESFDSEDPRWSHSLVAGQRSHAVRLRVAALRSHLASKPALLEQIEEAARDRLARLRGTADPHDDPGPRGELLHLFEDAEYGKARAGLVIDLENCTRCNACVETCAAVHDDGIPRISKVGVRAHLPGVQLVTACYHCKTPECMASCNDGAIRRRVDGLIDFIWDNCIGCQACAKACPFDVIRIVPYPLDPSILQRRELPGRKWLEGLERRLRGRSGSPEEGGEPSLVGRLAEWWTRSLAPVLPDCSHETSGYSHKKVQEKKAVQCDGCYGLGYQACVFNCPCDAIRRETPADALGLSSRVGVVALEEEPELSGEGP